ncbi:hypothetical protein B0A69_17780 [Chryseobacterium shigense]|uniref:Uncharacterized protein n=1 Tax=Chryseobacterium shigense TaxID=297244 RepID=A0A1N7ICN6_9FLAO|nr:hypothetical protein [Chryseobacterium shigense]PQA91650.1 hypothetical protein B0A69_17780 [Chryseobacterium shigense]SIS34828.1 hypothetical protein SAMN05421639_10389 [Chryseobacterium shigense]
MKPKPTLEAGSLEAVSGTNTIATDLVQKLIINYRDNQMQAINKELGITDAHAIWFDLPKLKKFISCIENEAAKVNPTVSEEDLGIRFYYAAYPKAEDWAIMASHPVEKEYAERHTLVMIPTLKKEDETGARLDYDFHPLHSGSTLAMAGKKGPTLPTDAIAENHGSLSPPDNPKAEMFP